MTTLIVHPKISVQKEAALKLVQKYLQQKINLENPPPDLHIIDGTLLTSIGIDDIRELCKRLQFQPYECPFQIGLIFSSDKLTTEAQNSFLKALEEPGPQTIFILTTPNEKFLLPTIISRSKKVYVSKNLLTNKQQSGQPSDTQQNPDYPNIDKFLNKNIVDKFLIIEDILSKEKEEKGIVTEFLHDILEHFRENLITSIRSNNNKQIIQYKTSIRKINRASHFISKNANKRLTLENLILQLEDSIM